MHYIPIDEALVYAIKDLRRPLVSDYDLGKILYEFYLVKGYKNFQLKLKKDQPTPGGYRRLKDKILNSGVIRHITESLSFPHYKVTGSPNLSDQEIICAIDTFAYISHFSAMKFHNLVNNENNQIFYTSPSPQLWKELALKKMRNELGDNFKLYLETGLPKLKRFALPEFEKRIITKYSTMNIGDYISINYRRLRVSTVGRTFLDMVRKPEYCGGMDLVVSIVEKNINPHIDEVLKEIDKYGNKIEKVRVGYILDEVCKINSSILDNWRQNAQRGGSQKLDSGKPYKPTYSEKWCLSINL